MSDDPKRQSFFDALHGPTGPHIRVFKDRHGRWIYNADPGIPDEVHFALSRLLKELNHAP